LGDNILGRNPDSLPFDFDNDNWGDPANLEIDEKGCLLNVEIGKDAFPENPLEWLDSDNDCIGDNADQDDDNDGYTDEDESLSGTNPYSAESKPVTTFELVIPGTNFGLGAWDIVGILGGVPLFIWISFCLMTRTSRARRFTEALNKAGSESELSEISKKYEWALMWRLIAPHQAIKLERIRSNLEFLNPKMKTLEGKFSDLGIVEDDEFFDEYTGPSVDLNGQLDSDGYEWLTHNERKYYRIDSGDKWIEWND